MSYAPTRRQILQGGSALLAAATLGLIRPNAAFAAHDKITVRVERDLGNLDPANRTGPLDVNILNAVMQGLIAFKPGSTEWQLDAAADIKQVSDTEIDFTCVRTRTSPAAMARSRPRMSNSPSSASSPRTNQARRSTMPAIGRPSITWK
jgi:hypothetical protein